MALSADFCLQRGETRLDVAIRLDEQVAAIYGGSSGEEALLLRCLEGKERPDRGRIVVNGTIWFDSVLRKNLPTRKRGICRIPAPVQGKRLVRTLFSACCREDRSTQLAKQFGLTDLLDRPVAQLTPQELFRLQTALALASDPDVLVLEEQALSMEEDLRLDQELVLREALSGFAGTTVFAAMSRGTVWRLCDQLCVMRYGCVDQQYSVRELFERPQTVAAGRLAGYRNMTAIQRIDETHVYAPAWNTVLRMTYVPEDAYYLGIHPSACRLSAGPGENVLLCHVCRSLEQPDRVTVIARPEGGTHTPVVLEVPREQWKANDSVFVAMPSESILPLR